MCIVKTNIGNEKINAFITFSVKKSFLGALIHNNYKQEPKIDHVIASNNFINGTCRFLKCALMPIHYIFVEYSACFHLVISTV